MANRRVEVGFPTPIQTTFYTPNSESSVDLDSTPTVGVKHVNGTTIIAGPQATTHVGITNSGTYQFTLPAQAAPASLIVTWTGLMGGATVTRTEYIDVIGRFMVELGEIRAVSADLADTNAYPTSLLIAKRDAAEDLFEQVTGAWTSRYSLDQLDGDSTYRRAYMPVESSVVYEPNLSRRLMLMNKLPNTVLSVGFWDGTQVAYVPDTMPSGWGPGGAGTQAQYLSDNYFLYPSGEIERALVDMGWPRGVKNVQIEYLYGRTDAPRALKEAMLAYCRFLVLETTSRVSGRATSITNEGGTIQLGQAHEWLAPTGIPDIDAVLRRFDERAIAIA